MECLQEVRSLSLSHALNVTDSPLRDDELIVKILSGLGPEYRDISAAIQARDSSLSNEELFQKLTDHELFVKNQDLEKSFTIITAAVEQKVKMPPQSNRNYLRFNNQ